jgi:hypothetical protein
VRLSPTASVETCVDWLHQYFAEHPKEPVDAIFTYQADVVVDLDIKQLVLTHFMANVEAPVGRERAKSGIIGKEYFVRFAPGKSVDEPTRLALYNDEANEFKSGRRILLSTKRYLSLVPGGRRKGGSPKPSIWREHTRSC